METTGNGRAIVFGLPLDLLTLDETVERMISLARARSGFHQHVVLNAAKVVTAQSDEELRGVLMACDIVSADGMAIVWAGKLLGIPVPERVAGIDVMIALVARAEQDGLRLYFLGAKQPVLDAALRALSESYPGLRVAGSHNGYWNEHEESAIVRDIARSESDVLFVAMPSPQKELFLRQHGERLNVPLAMGVGGSFDVIGGFTRRAPGWMQRFGLEWLFRLVQEPRRMARRYFVGNSKFLWLVFRSVYSRLRGFIVGTIRDPA